MRRRQVIALLCAVPGLWSSLGWAAAPGRKALVIGNARYAELPLDNPENDARLLAQTLRSLGFEVAEYLNLGVREFRRVLRDFARSVRDDDSAAVFYYAGHGVQINGRNYLLPVDVNLRDADEVRDESIDLEEVLSRGEAASAQQARIFIIDACRDNPFSKLPPRPERPERARKGLAVTGASGSLIAFSAGPGSTSEDGPPGSNSVYSRRLALAMREPGLPIESLLKRVATQVREDTQGRQVPWVNTSMEVDFSFNPVAPAPGKDLALAAPLAATAVPRLNILLQADRLLNTDLQQRPASLALRVYLLRDASSFQRASFDALYDNDDGTLGPDLLAREIVHLRPGGTRELSLPLAPAAQAVGVFGAFRELAQSQWRAVLPLPKPGAAQGVQVDAQARRVQLAWVG